MQLFGDMDCDSSNAIARAIANDTIDFWNENIGRAFGIFFVLHEKRLVDCCERAAQCLSGEAFPANPGPYKRAATFLVFGVLYDFVTPLTVTGSVLSPIEKRQWVVRLMALSIAPMVCQLNYVNNGLLRDLPPWKGFPSDHYKLEFFEWLRRLDDLGWAKLKYGVTVDVAVKHFEQARLARMVLATTLALESCHYVSMCPGPVDPVRNNYRLDLGLLEHMQIDLYYDDSTKLAKLV